MIDLSPLNSVLGEIGDQGANTFDLTGAQDGQRLRGNGRQYVRFYYRKESRPVTTKAKIDPKTGASTPLKIEMQEFTREFVEIINPGDKNIVDQPAEDFHRREFSKQYFAFRKGNGVQLGTPIDDVSYVPPHVATELLYHGCKTEEQLADASDVLCGLIPDGFRLRDFAKAVVNAKNDSKGDNRVLGLQEKNAKLEASLAEMQEQVAALMRGEHKIERRGRPRKQVVETEEVESPLIEGME